MSTGDAPEINPRVIPEGWRFETRTRRNGKSAGTTDTYYISPAGFKFRSKLEVQRALNAQNVTSKATPVQSAPGVTSKFFNSGPLPKTPPDPPPEKNEVQISREIHIKLCSSVNTNDQSPYNHEPTKSCPNPSIPHNQEVLTLKNTSPRTVQEQTNEVSTDHTVQQQVLNPIDRQYSITKPQPPVSNSAPTCQARNDLEDVGQNARFDLSEKQSDFRIQTYGDTQNMNRLLNSNIASIPQSFVSSRGTLDEDKILVRPPAPSIVKDDDQSNAIGVILGTDCRYGETSFGIFSSSSVERLVPTTPLASTEDCTKHTTDGIDFEEVKLFDKNDSHLGDDSNTSESLRKNPTKSSGITENPTKSSGITENPTESSRISEHPTESAGITGNPNGRLSRYKFLKQRFESVSCSQAGKSPVQKQLNFPSCLTTGTFRGSSRIQSTSAAGPDLDTKGESKLSTIQSTSAVGSDPGVEEEPKPSISQPWTSAIARLGFHADAHLDKSHATANRIVNEKRSSFSNPTRQGSHSYRTDSNPTHISPNANRKDSTSAQNDLNSNKKSSVSKAASLPSSFGFAFRRNPRNITRIRALRSVSYPRTGYVASSDSCPPKFVPSAPLPPPPPPPPPSSPPPPNPFEKNGIPGVPESKHAAFTTFCMNPTAIEDAARERNRLLNLKCPLFLSSGGQVRHLCRHLCYYRAFRLARQAPDRFMYSVIPDPLQQEPRDPDAPMRDNRHPDPSQQDSQNLDVSMRDTQYTGCEPSQLASQHPVALLRGTRSSDLSKLETSHHNPSISDRLHPNFSVRDSQQLQTPMRNPENFPAVKREGGDLGKMNSHRLMRPKTEEAEHDGEGVLGKVNGHKPEGSGVMREDRKTKVGFHFDSHLDHEMRGSFPSSATAAYRRIIRQSKYFKKTHANKEETRPDPNVLILDDDDEIPPAKLEAIGTDSFGQTAPSNEGNGPKRKRKRLGSRDGPGIPSYENKDAASRNTPKTALHPPESPFGLLEEVLWDDPWALLLACLLLSVSQGGRRDIDPILADLLVNFPVAESAAQASEYELSDVLGGGRVRVNLASLRRLTQSTPHDEEDDHRLRSPRRGSRGSRVGNMTKIGSPTDHSLGRSPPSAKSATQIHRSPGGIIKSEAGDQANRGGGCAPHTCAPEQPSQNSEDLSPSMELARAIKRLSGDFVRKWGWWFPASHLHTVHHNPDAAAAHALFCERLWQSPHLLNQADPTEDTSGFSLGVTMDPKLPKLSSDTNAEDSNQRTRAANSQASYLGYGLGLYRAWLGAQPSFHRPRGIVVGQAPGKNRCDKPLCCRPLQGLAERRVAKLAGVSVQELWHHFQRINLLNYHPGRKGRDPKHVTKVTGYSLHMGDGDTFPLAEARAAARRIPLEGYACALLLGLNVARAFQQDTRIKGLKAELFHEAEKDGCLILVLPHPSGISHFWNSPENIEKAKLCLKSAFLRSGIVFQNMENE